MNESDLISRQEAIDALNKRARETFTLADGYQFYLGALHDVADDIRKLPSAQPKKGKWTLHENQRQEDVENGNYLYICSECGKSDIHAKAQEVPFCWWCGADMRGEEE